jgi:hypothetical protein
MERLPSVAIAGLPWYEADSYQAVKALVHDRDRLFRTYADWLAAAERTEQQLRRNGTMTVRVVLDTEQFPAWCARHRPRQHVDGKIRADYAAFIAAQQHRAGQEGTGRH